MSRKKYASATTPEISIISERVKYLQTFLSNRSNHIEMRRKAIERLGNKCIKCGFDNYLALNIDHINGDGNRERLNGQFSYYKKLLTISDEELHSNYQCLCSNCNQIKKYEEFEWYMTPEQYDKIVEEITLLRQQRKQLRINFWRDKLKPYKESNLSYAEIGRNIDASSNTVSSYMKQLGWKNYEEAQKWTK
jgi:hypothetical protein